MNFSQQVIRKSAHQKATGQFANPFANQPDPFAGSKHIFDNAKFHNPFAASPKHGGAPGGAKKGPLKRLTVPSPHPGSPGRKIADAFGKHGTPAHKSMVDPNGGVTFVQLIEAVIKGLIHVGDTIILMITGLGEVIVHITDAVIQAARSAWNQTGGAIARGGSDLDRWLFEHGALIMIGGWALVILGAVVLL